LRASGRCWPPGTGSPGRDIGTVVAPHAELKIFLTADSRERARRRAEQTGRPLEEVLAEQHERDDRDATREVSPLEAAADAMTLDTTGLTLAEVVDRIVALAADAQRSGAASEARS
jgi:cytidylate kinase